jgi:hypothetical protein
MENITYIRGNIIYEGGGHKYFKIPLKGGTLTLIILRGGYNYENSG